MKKLFLLEYKFDRKVLTVLAKFPDETASDGGGKDAIIDGKLDTWWHSKFIRMVIRLCRIGLL